MNVKNLFSKWLFALLIVASIFALGSIDVFAGEGTGGATQESLEYTIRNWRKVMDSNYDEEAFWNVDVLCSSSTKSNQLVTDNTLDEETAADNKCLAEDETIHKYYVWKMIDGAQPFTKSISDAHSSFSEYTHLFSLAGTDSGKGWREYTGKDVRNENGKEVYRKPQRDANGDIVKNKEGKIMYDAPILGKMPANCEKCVTGDGTVDQWDATKEGYTNGNIQYVIVYLHRMSRGFDLYENFRTEDVYDGSVSGTNYDNVKTSSKAYYLTDNNGAFRVTNTILYYNTVPHVLGTEGMGQMIVAIMDEGTGRPVPVKLNKNATGFSSVRTTLAVNYDDSEIVKKLQQAGGAQGVERYFPYGGDSLQADYTTIWEAKEASHYKYNAFIYQYSEGGVTKSTTIDERGGLGIAIKAAGGPQYIATVEIALSETITQRNSAYAFMSAYGTNGGNYSTGNGITNGNNTSPENTRGVFYLSPRSVYYYLNGNTASDIRNSNTINVIKLRMRSDVETNASGYKNLATNAVNNAKGLNRNFKHTFATYTRGACFTKSGNRTDCYERVMFNYFNDIDIQVINIDGNKYFAYKLIPNTATCSDSSTICTVKENNGISTFYYSKNNTSAGKKQYSNAENAWGVWRQVGWSVNGVEMGGGFAPDTREFPKAADEVQTDFSSDSNMCRWSWSERYYYNNESDYNKGYIEHYITKSGGVINEKIVTADTNGEYNHYEELTDVYLTILRTFPDMIFRTFEFTKYIKAGTNNPVCEGTVNGVSHAPYPGITSAKNNATATQLADINKEEAQIAEITAFKTGKANYDKIAEKLCENLGLDCNSVSSFETASKKASGKKMSNEIFANSYLAIVDALQTKDEYNISYAEHMAYAFYNFYTLVGLPDEYTVGTMFACRLEGRYYSFEDVLLGDKSNIIVLNEENRLGTQATGNVDENGNSVGTNLSSLGHVLDAEAQTVVGPISIGEKYGPELYLINETTGEVYVPELEEQEMKCPSGYTRDGNKCRAVHTIAYNRNCDEGYAFDFTQFKCVETASGETHCPDGYVLEGSVCVSYDGTNPICDDGYWDPEKRVCLEYTDAYCKTGYTLTDVTEPNKLAASTTYSFARGNGDFGKFTGSGIKNFRQDSDSTISYDLDSTNGYIEITGLNLDPTKVNLIQIKMKNASIGDTAKIYYTTENSTDYNEAKTVSFKVEPDSDANYYIYTVDMTGGMWNSAIKSLRFKLSSVNKGTIIIDNISFGSENPDYRPDYKCIKDLDPVCPTNFTYYKGRCYGYASDLTNIPDVYELDCSHIVPQNGEKVTLASFRVGDYVNFEHGTSASVFTVPVSGTYYLELWGAANGTGKGGYTAGMADLEEGDILYVYTATENSARSTTIYNGGLTYGNILATATSEVAGTNNLKAVTGINKITKTGSDYFKAINNIGNTSWTGEKGHSGNGFARITLYSAGGLTAVSGSKTGTVKEPVNKTFGFTGTVQSMLLEPGTYTLEVWGAQGGSYSTYQLGGKGGYAKGTYKPTTNTTVYVSVGEQPTSYNGGWNGGGYGGRGGGGATHIATEKKSSGGGTQAPSIVSGSFSASTPYCWLQTNTGCTYENKYAYSDSASYFDYHCSGWVRASQYDYNVDGVLSGLSNNKSAILLVAGGGGGAQQYQTNTYSTQAVPGAGGGTTGGGGVSYQGSSTSCTLQSGNGGTQSAGGANPTGSSTLYVGTAGSFGQGGNGYSTTSGAGGGGYYGGSGGAYTSCGQNYATGGGGGSGYVNTSKLSATSMENGKRDGHGYAKISGTTNVSATLGYYILQDENGKELGACLVHSSSIDMSNRGGLELYVNNGYINKCGVEATCEYIAQEGSQVASSVHNFGYTGGVQSILLEPGTYKFEAWGAQGGDGTNHSGGAQPHDAGKGGYTYATVTVSVPTTYYIYVGGKGSTGASAAGGYNGGGQTGNASYDAGTGGGATHIATTSGLLSSLSNNKSSIVIVAGGGGGGGNDSIGGHGGGINGVQPSTSTQFSSRTAGIGGTQSSGYQFGQGQGRNGENLAGGGGGGYYGGGQGDNSTGGGGGSGYIKSSLSGATQAGSVTFYSPAGAYETGHTGNGYVRITGLEEKVDKYYKVCTDGTITEVDKSEVDNSQITNNKQSFSIKNQQNFSYTGYPQAITLEPGTYTFEVWGGQGGSGYTNADYKGVGGKGGYTKATVKVTSTTTYYIYVGGKGTDGTAGGTHAGGFNGGGIGDDYAGGGGGATHIATAPGELSTLSGNTASVIVVAGGGGGGMNYQANTTYLKNGGAGGGTTGGDGASTNSYIATGGTQSAGGTNGQASNTTYNGSFGKGGRYHSTSYDSGGGGGGWYGGGSGYQNSSGAGGSGYVKSGLSGSTTANKREGNGYARITKTANVEKAATQVWGYSYTGKVQTVTLDPGTYKLEVWGAQGGDGMNGTVFAAGGKGGYSSGVITFAEQTTLNLYVGGSGKDGSTSVEAAGGWNGGGSGYYYAGGGGGASDIRLGGTALNDRILVAGGGGGGSGYSTSHTYIGGAGGGFEGSIGAGNYYNTYTHYVANQSQGGYSSYRGINTTYSGTLGTGGRYDSNYTGGGGGGYYGGQGGVRQYGAGSGGSGYADTILLDAALQSGLNAFSAPTGETEIGHTGHGYILISDMSDTYGGGSFSGNRDVISYTTINGPLEAEDFSVTKYVSLGSGYYATDVLIGRDYLYLVRQNMNYVTVYTRNSDGTIGTYVGTRDWISSSGDTTAQYISTGSQPSAYTTYYKDGVTKLIGWSYNSSLIYEWTIDESTHYITGRTQYSAPRTFGYYGRAAWDGEDTVYFVDGRGNSSSEYLYKFDINSKEITFIANLSGADYSYSSYTAAAAYIDKVNNHIYLSEAANCGCGHSLVAYDLSNGSWVKTITASQMHAAGVRINGGQYSNMAIMIDPTNPSVGWAMTTDQTGVAEMNISNNRVVKILPTYVEEDSSTYTYTGGVQTVTLDPGTYKLEVWGAQGGQGYSSSNYIGIGGKGGYSAGFITLLEETTLKLYVGGMGASDNATCNYPSGGWNGGGQGYCYSGGGGGATDIRLGGTDLSNRIIVAGGGGGGSAYSSYVANGGAGGGYSGRNGTYHQYWNVNYPGIGGTQTSGGIGYYNNDTYNGSWGQGGRYYTSYAAGGGGGYYGGSGGNYNGTSGGGGSGYIGGVNNGYTFDGTMTFAGVDGTYENGHSGNGAIKISKIKSIAANSGVCSIEARLKIIPTCTNGVAFDVNTNKCTLREALICKSGSAYNVNMAKCEANVAPSGCTNEGEVYRVGTKYYCMREADAWCDNGYEFADGVCMKKDLNSYQNELCTAPYTFVKETKNGKTTGKCQFIEERDISEFNKISLEGEMNNVEVGKIYKLTNYVGYNTTAARGARYVDGGLRFASTALFPTLNVEFTLVAPKTNKLVTTELCRVCRTGGENYDADACGLINLATDCADFNGNEYDTYKISIPIKLNNDIINGGLESVLAGNRTTYGHMISTTPAPGIKLTDDADEEIIAAEVLWSMWQGTDTGFIIDSDFSTLWSAIDVYFQFKEDKFCYYNAPSEDQVEFSKGICVDYEFKEGQEKFIKIEDGVKKLNMEEDENGETYVKNIFISTIVGTPHTYVDPHFEDKNNNGVALADVYMDNTKFTDDRSDLISGFKLAPDGDVYIDRFEVLDATTLQVVFAADARTLDRCSDGDELNTGSTAKFTTTTTFNKQTNLYDLAYDNGAVRAEADKVKCNYYDPNSEVHKLEGDRNYIIKVYTKYEHIKESNIAADTDAPMSYISVDIQHLGNSSSKNILSEIIPSMENAALTQKFVVRTGSKNPDGTCVAIKHKTNLEISPTNMLKSKPVDNKCELSASVAMDSIQRFYTKNNNNMLTVAEPNAVMIIPADGLKNKGTTDGMYSATVSGEVTTMNAYASWDNFTFNYSLGEGPDVKTTLLMKCVHKTSREVVEFITRTNACVLIDTTEYEDCDLYARIENIGNKDIGISTNIRVNYTTENINETLDVYQGELYNADGTSKFFLTNAATYGGHETFTSTSGGSETGHAGHGYARITDVDSGRVIKSFSYTGGVQSITLNKGNYKLEVWGAQGGSKWGIGGLGGYSVGTMAISKTVTANVYVGGHPADNSLTGGWNGGGDGGEAPSVQVYRSPGGGATDIRIDGTALEDRIIVAGGGGGGAKYATNQHGGPGGGSTAHFNYYSTWGTPTEYQSQNYGASQTESCRASVDSYGYQITCSPGALGQGSSACGGGYYGGGYYSCANRVYSGSGGSGYVRVSTTKNQLTGDSSEAEVLVKADITQNIKANAIHNSEDNDMYADINWTNNFDENCWLFDYTNYSVENLKVNPTKIWVPTDCDGKTPTNGGLVNVEISGSYEVVKEFDGGDNKNVQIEYVLTDTNKNKLTSTCTITPVAKMMTGTSGSKEVVEFTGTCAITFKGTDLGNFVGFTVAINGGATADEAKHPFKESTYSDNEDMVSISVAAKPEGENCMPVCDDTCTTRNTWGVNFDFLYTFDRNVHPYKTNKYANMSWVDYDVGTVSGETKDLDYSQPVDNGNINRAPDNYMAFKSDKIDTVELCTDYKSNFKECWRYEMNVSHNVTYYLWSEAITSVYTTHKVLTSDVGTGTNDAGECDHENATFVNGSETYGDVNSGESGENHNFSNSSETDRKVNVCHGFTEAPNTTACTVATDWWGNKICDEWTTTFSPDKSSGSKPTDYIPYKNFQDYTLSDGAGTSPTTETDRIVLKNQTQTNLDQGAGHAGWVETKTMDVCTEKAYMNISYKCNDYYTYGTADGTKKYAQTNGDEGNGVCYAVGYGTTERTCAWEDTENSPPEEVWWDDSGATCYRQHRDYTCDRYYSFSNTNSVDHNSGNTMEGVCNWSETVSPVTKFWTGTDKSTCSNSCSSTCTSWNKDASGNPTSCARYSSGTCRCSGSNGCARSSGSCSYGGGTGCTATGEGTATHYYGSATWTASDGQSTSSSKDNCSGVSFSSHTFYHSETYNGSGSGNNMHYQCSSGDLNTGGYCYEYYNDSASLTRDDLRCVRWTTKEYQEIKYYTTSTPDSTTSSDEKINGWVSRTYSDPTEIWQYTCDTTEPKVAYPNDTVFLKSYAEEITATSWIKTVSSGDEWIQLNFEGNTPPNARPRSGEWFDLKFVTTYTTTRGERPGSGTTNRPYLTDFYNNYHNIEGELGADNATIYPPGGYNHFGTTDTGKTAIGDGKTMIAESFEDIVNNEDYGYCSARPAEPYGCSYQDGTNQFMYPGKNNTTTTQGHGGAEWTTNQEGNGVCYYGPDNKTVWQKFEFGNDYYTALLICSGDNQTVGCTVDNALATAYLDRGLGECLNYADGLCVKYQITWETPIRQDAAGNQRRGFYLEAGWDNSKNLVFDLRSSKFDAVGQYEKELLGENILASKEGQQFFEQVGNPIKPMCVCQTTKTGGDPNDYKWGSTEWEVE